MKRFALLPVLTLGLIGAFAAIPAFADSTLLNTFSGPENLSPGPDWGLFQFQSLAVPFTVTNAVTVNSIVAAITVEGGVNVGIMTDAGGLPSDSWLYSQLWIDPIANISLGNVNWSLGAGNYWLAAVVVADGAGIWPGGKVVNGPWAYNSGDPASWVLTTALLQRLSLPVMPPTWCRSHRASCSWAAGWWGWPASSSAG